MSEDVYTRLREFMEEQKLDTALTIHELRHSLLTACVGRFKYPQEVRRRIANQISGDVLERVYVHHSWDNEAKEVWARWGVYLDSLLEDRGKVVEMHAGAAS